PRGGVAADADPQGTAVGRDPCRAVGRGGPRPWAGFFRPNRPGRVPRRVDRRDSRRAGGRGRPAPGAEGRAEVEPGGRGGVIVDGGVVGDGGRRRALVPGWQPAVRRRGAHGRPPVRGTGPRGRGPPPPPRGGGPGCASGS